MKRLVRTGKTALLGGLLAAVAATAGPLSTASAAARPAGNTSLAGTPTPGSSTPAAGTPAPDTATAGTPAAGTVAAGTPAADTATAGTVAAGTAGTGHGQTIVTFGWGGGNASQLPGLPLFRKYGMHGTYYIPSGLVCFPRRGVDCTKSQYLTLPDIRKIAADGNEIGGLTVTHLRLDTLSAAEAKRQICHDRVNLTRWGFRVTDFAYPYAVASQRSESLARQCGYNSGLGAGQTRGGGACRQCIYAESVPPRNPMLIRAPVEVNSALSYHWTPADFERAIRGAERHGGGWIVFLIHDICSSYCQYGITLPQLRTVVRWVHERIGPRLQVKTVRQVIGGSIRPVHDGPAPRPLPGGIANRSLENLSRTGYPSCFQAGGYGSNTASFSYQPHGGPNGAATETIRMTSRRSGDAKFLVRQDLGACSPPAVPGRTYVVGARYKTSSPRTQIDVYYRNKIGAWRYWASSPVLPVTSRWRKASWTTPPVPAGATAITFGLAVGSPGTLTTTGYIFAPGHPRRGHLIVALAVLLALALPLLGWRLWHTRAKPAPEQPALLPGNQQDETGRHTPTGSG